MGVDVQRLLAVGLSHRTAPVAIRERLALDEDGVRDLLLQLRAEQVVDEAFLLSTCNRVELYTVPRSVDGVRSWLGGFRGPRGERIDPYLYWYWDREAVTHLFRVASSLDSLVVGEPQILGQVKAAVRLAEEHAALGILLQPLVRHTLSVAKRVRTHTDIGRNRVGIGNAGVDLALQVFGALDGKRAMLIGVGEMGRQVARALLSAGLEELLVANRTYEHALDVAGRHGGTAIPYERLREYLPRADIVLVATASRTPLVTSEMVRRAIKQRRYEAMFLVDLAVPRNIQPSVGDIEEAYLFDIDDLSHVVARGHATRAAAAQVAQQFIDEEADRFFRSLREVDVGPDLGRIARWAEAIRQEELVRSLRLVRTLDADQQGALDAMTRALVKKLLHHPMTALRDAARDGDQQRVEVLKALWDELDS